MRPGGYSHRSLTGGPRGLRVLPKYYQIALFVKQSMAMIRMKSTRIKKKLYALMEK